MTAMTALCVLAIVFCSMAVVLYARTTEGRRDATLETPATDAGLDPRGLVTVALAVRVLAAVVIFASGTADVFAVDRWGYEHAGAAIAEAWRAGLPPGRAALDAANGTLRLYHYVNGAAFYLFGGIAPLVMMLVNAGLGTWTVLLTWRIAERLGGKRTALFAATCVTFLPSLVLWSALNIRDVWAIAAILSAIDAAMALQMRLKAFDVVRAVASLGVLGAIRGYVFLLVAVAIVFSFAVPLGRSMVRSYVIGLVVGLGLLYVYSTLGFGRDLVESASFETLNAQRQALTQGADSAFYGSVDISRPDAALAFLPIGMTYFLFAPFPWMMRKTLQLLTLPEMLVWWWLAFRYCVPGTRALYARASRGALTILSVAAVMVVAYGLAEGNVGTAYRHRAQVLPLLIVVAALGREATRASRASRAATDATDATDAPDASPQRA